MDPRWYPNPADGEDVPRARVEALECAICGAEWEEWVGPEQQAAACPTCGFHTDLGEAG